MFVYINNQVSVSLIVLIPFVMRKKKLVFPLLVMPFCCLLNLNDILFINLIEIR